MEQEKIKDQFEVYLGQLKNIKANLEKDVEQLKALAKITYEDISIEGKKAKVGVSPDGKIIIHFEFKDDGENFLQGLKGQ